MEKIKLVDRFSEPIPALDLAKSVLVGDHEDAETFINDEGTVEVWIEEIVFNNKAYVCMITIREFDDPDLELPTSKTHAS